MEILFLIGVAWVVIEIIGIGKARERDRERFKQLGIDGAWDVKVNDAADGCGQGIGCFGLICAILLALGVGGGG